MKRFVFLSLSLLALLILIPGCYSFPPLSPNPVVTLPVILVFSNSPSTINAGDASILLWNVTGATSVSIDQGIGQVDVAGTRVIQPAQSTVYTISATNSAGTVSRSAVTTVNSTSPAAVGTPPVIITFSNYLNSDGTSTLWWNVTGATSASIDQGIGQVNIAGTKIVSPAIYTVYTISATNSTGTVTRSATTVYPTSPAAAPVPFAVTSVVANISPSIFSGACPNTFTLYATITATGPGTVTYRWEREDLRYSDTKSVTFNAAGTQTTTLQWNFGETSSGWIRVHMLTPTEITSIPVNYILNCGG